MTTLEIILLGYIVLNWFAFTLIAIIPKRHWKTLVFLTFVLNPIVSIFLTIKFLKAGNEE